MTRKISVKFNEILPVPSGENLHLQEGEGLQFSLRQYCLVSRGRLIYFSIGLKTVILAWLIFGGRYPVNIIRDAKQIFDEEYPVVVP